MMDLGFAGRWESCEGSILACGSSSFGYCCESLRMKTKTKMKSDRIDLLMKQSKKKKQTTRGETVAVEGVELSLSLEQVDAGDGFVCVSKEATSVAVDLMVMGSSCSDSTASD